MPEKSFKKIVHDALFGDAKSLVMADFRQALSAIVDEIVQFRAGLILKVDTAIANLQGMKEKIDTAIAGIKNGEDGKDSTVPGPKGEPGEPGKDSVVPGPKGEPGEPGKDGSPDTGEQIIGKINKDKSDYLIRRGKVEGLEEMESAIRTADANIRSWNNSGSFVYDYELDSQLNGVLKTFALPANAKIIMVFGTSAPFRFSKNVDYTYTGSAITFTSQIDAASTLAAGQGVTILYKLV